MYSELGRYSFYMYFKLTFLVTGNTSMESVQPVQNVFVRGQIQDIVSCFSVIPIWVWWSHISEFTSVHLLLISQNKY